MKKFIALLLFFAFSVWNTYSYNYTDKDSEKELYEDLTLFYKTKIEKSLDWKKYLLDLDKKIDLLSKNQLFEINYQLNNNLKKYQWDILDKAKYLKYKTKYNLITGKADNIKTYKDFKNNFEFNYNKNLKIENNELKTKEYKRIFSFNLWDGYIWLFEKDWKISDYNFENKILNWKSYNYIYSEKNWVFYESYFFENNNKIYELQFSNILNISNLENYREKFEQILETFKFIWKNENSQKNNLNQSNIKTIENNFYKLDYIDEDAYFYKNDFLNQISYKDSSLNFIISETKNYEKDFKELINKFKYYENFKYEKSSFNWYDSDKISYKKDWLDIEQHFLKISKNNIILISKYWNSEKLKEIEKSFKLKYTKEIEKNNIIYWYNNSPETKNNNSSETKNFENNFYKLQYKDWISTEEWNEFSIIYNGEKPTIFKANLIEEYNKENINLLKNIYKKSTLNFKEEKIKYNSYDAEKLSFNIYWVDMEQIIIPWKEKFIYYITQSWEKDKLKEIEKTFLIK